MTEHDGGHDNNSSIVANSMKIGRKGIPSRTLLFVRCWHVHLGGSRLEES